MAEYAGVAGDGRGVVPIIEGVLDCCNGKGRSYWKLGVPDRLALRYLPDAAEAERSNAIGSTSIDGRWEPGTEAIAGGSKLSGTTKFS